MALVGEICYGFRLSHDCRLEEQCMQQVEMRRRLRQKLVEALVWAGLGDQLSNDHVSLLLRRRRRLLLLLLFALSKPEGTSKSQSASKLGSCGRPTRPATGV